MTFDLNEAIETALGSELNSPHEIADKVFPAIPANEIPTLARRLLSGYVREYLQARRASNPVLGGARETPDGASTTAPRPSAKLAARRAGWPGWMLDRVHIGHGTWRRLGECTRDDLLFAAGERDTMAASNSAKAERFRTLAAKLEAHGAATVSALPPGILDAAPAA